jgi:DNA-binding GntR family transcriptional regulator
MEWIEILHANVARYLSIYLAGLNYQIASQNEHRAILDACRHGAVEAATAHLTHHLESASRHLVDCLYQEEP